MINSHIDLYVNDFTISLGSEGRSKLKKFLRIHPLKKQLFLFKYIFDILVNKSITIMKYSRNMAVNVVIANIINTGIFFSLKHQVGIHLGSVL